MDLNVHNSNFPIIEINRTNIAIIPQKKITPSEWLIFLRNVIYKLISKTLANHLKSLLPQIIIENQSAFTWERVITDNVLVAFKLMHYLNHKHLVRIVSWWLRLIRVKPLIKSNGVLFKGLWKDWVLMQGGLI